jgi:hypothetical protein
MKRHPAKAEEGVRFELAGPAGGRFNSADELELSGAYLWTS